MDVINLIKKMDTCSKSTQYFCASAGGMCFGSTQYCDKNHDRLKNCLPTDREEAFQYCQSFHNTIASDVHAQCKWACYERFNITTFYAEGDCGAWCVAGLTILSVLLIVSIGLNIWQRWNCRQKNHQYRLTNKTPEDTVGEANGLHSESEKLMTVVVDSPDRGQGESIPQSNQREKQLHMENVTNERIENDKQRHVGGTVGEPPSGGYHIRPSGRLDTSTSNLSDESSTSAGSATDAQSQSTFTDAGSMPSASNQPTPPHTASDNTPHNGGRSGSARMDGEANKCFPAPFPCTGGLEAAQEGKLVSNISSYEAQHLQ